MNTSLRCIRRLIQQKYPSCKNASGETLYHYGSRSVISRSYGNTQPLTVDTSVPKEAENTVEPLSSKKLQVLYERITKLPEEEVNILGALVIQVLGKQIFPGEFGGGVGGVVGMVHAVAGEEEPIQEEKTSFDCSWIRIEFCKAGGREFRRLGNGKISKSACSSLLGS